MKYKITKKKVIEAILTEPLGSGHFFLNFRDDGKCKVCAVGAILRATKKDHFDSNNAFEATNGTANYEKNNFLSILSCEFEDYMQDFDSTIDEARLHCLNVIEAFCPEVLEFET